MEFGGVYIKCVGAAPALVSIKKNPGDRKETASTLGHHSTWSDHMHMQNRNLTAFTFRGPNAIRTTSWNISVLHAALSRKRPGSDCTQLAGGKRLFVPRTTSQKEYLDEMFSKLALDKVDKQKSKRIVDETLKTLMGYVDSQIDGGQIYSQQFINAGSYPVKTKIGKADEFDVNIPLNIDWRLVRFDGTVKYDFGYSTNTQSLHNDRSLCYVPEGKLILAGYAVVEVGSGNVPKKFLHEHLLPKTILDVRNILGLRQHSFTNDVWCTGSNRSATYVGCIELIPLDVKKDLFNRMRSSYFVSRNKDVYISSVSHGPALKMTIVQKGIPGVRHNIDVDITVSLHCNIPLTAFGWPREKTRKAFSHVDINEVIQAGTHLVPKKDLFWAISFSKAEKALIKCLDRDQGCRKYVMKLLKKYVQICSSQSENGLPGISSHIIKTQVLWSCEEHSRIPNYWHRDNRDNCLINTMREIEYTLRFRRLQEYFNPALNILEGKELSVLNELSEFLNRKRVILLNLSTYF